MLRRDLTREEAIRITRKVIDETDGQVYLNELRAHYPYLAELFSRMEEEYIYPMPIHDRC